MRPAAIAHLPPAWTLPTSSAWPIRIGDFFEAYPDRTEALEGISNHIEKFWEPRMHWQLLDFLTDHPDGTVPGISLHPLLLQAVTLNLARLTPHQAHRA